MIGVDFAGPVFVELTSYLTAPIFIHSFIGFQGRRGPPSFIVSARYYRKNFLVISLYQTVQILLETRDLRVTYSARILSSGIVYPVLHSGAGF